MGTGLIGFVNSLDRRKEVWVLWPEHLDDVILSVSGELVTRGSLVHSVCVLSTMTLSKDTQVAAS